MRVKAGHAATLVGIALIAALPAKAEPTFPKLTGRVTDAANVIPDDVEARLDTKLAALEKQSRRQLVVATIPSLDGYEISDYGYQLGRAWGIGDKGRNDGAILIVAPAERKLRIEVGYGLEGTLTDAVSWQVINTAIVPRLKAGDMAGGIEAGTDRLVQILQLPPDQAAQVAKEAEAAQAAEAEGGGNVMSGFFILFILLFFVLPILRAMFGGRGRKRRGFGSPVIWMPPMGGGWGSGGGGFGGGGFGGGGFWGGGGSFGGGGSSGSW